MIHRPKFIYRTDLRLHPTALFVFGDNLARVGLGGQAKEMRGEPNAVGVPTKLYPANTPSAFFSNSSLDNPQVKTAIDEAFERLTHALQNGHDVYIPFDGLGTGLADLPRRAPKVQAYIDARIAELYEITRGFVTATGSKDFLNDTERRYKAVPEPTTEYGLYHYRAACPVSGCSWSNESDKGMNGPETAYYRHFGREHTQC